ncbi:hypothetical protein ACFP1I_03535 [Dyadobacter subterraneus]|uniref:Uncharacterized protein n=1 Tax=Dyadobacter subterraneus TaxID=2773304 RepID=A0ABR9W4F7_9BACT|nr:hypothetical protein [Dyadobacter subterraneus]MBE9460331.1 hypothetical protein [Dyadobacter subterraneus]
MLKRTFVLFFCIGQILASALFFGQAEASCRTNFGIANLSPFNNKYYLEEDEVLEVDDSICLHQTFISADEFKWKENLSSLLRHRTSNYRFISLESVLSEYFHFSEKSVFQHYTRQVIGSMEGLLTLPDYYSFLHRLCPF